MSRRDANLDAIAPNTVPISFVQQLLQGARLENAQALEALRNEGISAELLHNAGARVTNQQYSNLYRSLARELDDETPGMFARPLRGGALKFLCLSVLGARNLLAAMRRFTQYFRLLLDDLHFKMSYQGSLVQIALVPNTQAVAANTYAQETMLKLVHGVASWLAGRKIPLARVDFSYACPSHASEYLFLFPGPAHFEQPLTALYFEKADLDVPIRQGQSSLGEFLNRAPSDWMFLTFSERILSHRVREHLSKHLAAPVAIEAVAKTFHMSLRSLSRHLGKEGTSFQAIKDELRRDVAIQQLTHTQTPIAIIGEEIGFIDPTTFYRAFKKWTGSPPGAYRRMPFARPGR